MHHTTMFQKVTIGFSHYLQVDKQLNYKIKSTQSIFVLIEILQMIKSNAFQLNTHIYSCETA